MKIHYLQHMPFEGLGFIGEWARAEGHLLSATRLYKGEALPEGNDFDLLVVMGGPMGACDDDQYPWLTAEKRFMEKAVEAGRPILGVCLGAQLLAAVHGARVYRNRHKEIGWFPITLTDEARNSADFAALPAQFMVFHWHGDTFDIPRGAVRIAESEACRNQAFMCGPGVIGLQFHLESTQTMIREFVRSMTEDLTEGPYVQKPAELLAGDDHFEVAHAALRHILNHLSTAAPAAMKPRRS